MKTKSIETKVLQAVKAECRRARLLDDMYDEQRVAWNLNPCEVEYEELLQLIHDAEGELGI